MEVSGQLHAPPALPQAKIPGNTRNNRLGGPQNLSGCFGEEKHFVVLPVTELQSVGKEGNTHYRDLA